MALYFKGANPTADLCVFATIDGTMKVMVIRRAQNSPAEGGKLALPGGFVDTRAQAGEYWAPGLEEPIDAATREAQEETGAILDSQRLKLIGIFEGAGRDPRDSESSWTKAHAYGILLDPSEAPLSLNPGDDASEAYFEDLDVVLGASLAFDHKKILLQALLSLGIPLPEGVSRSSVSPIKSRQP